MSDQNAIVTAQNEKPESSLDLSALLSDGRHFSERRGTTIHIIDAVTGRTVVAFTGDVRMPTVLERVQTPEGEAWLAPGVARRELSVRSVEYSPIILDLICQEIVNGKGLTEVCQLEGFPTYQTLCRWRRKHPEVNEAIEQARRDRAEVLRDETLAHVKRVAMDNLGTKGDVAATGVLLDATKWATGVDNERYNPKAKVDAAVIAPTQIIINTGIDRGERDVSKGS